MTAGLPAGTAVIVVSYGSADLLERNLAASVTGTPARVVVVENGERPDERERTRGLCADRGWTLLEPPGNLGFGGGCNLGVAEALACGDRVLVLLNPDLSLSPDGIATLVSRALTEPNALVAPRIDRPDGSAFSSGTTLLRLDNGTMLANRRRHELPAGTPVLEWQSGACLVVSAELWRRTGGFDEDYFLYWEDVDLSARVQRRASGHLVVVDDVVAVHDEGATHRTDRTGRAKSETYLYYNVRNRLLFARRWLAGASRRRWCWTTPLAVWTVLLQGGRRPLVTSLAPWRAVVRGVWAGPWHGAGPRRPALRS